jgi:hypothetical protein
MTGRRPHPAPRPAQEWRSPDPPHVSLACETGLADAHLHFGPASVSLIDRNVGRWPRALRLDRPKQLRIDRLRCGGPSRARPRFPFSLRELPIAGRKPNLPVQGVSRAFARDGKAINSRQPNSGPRSSMRLPAVQGLRDTISRPPRNEQVSYWDGTSPACSGR